MVQIELVPDLSHCIETLAKKEYENLIKGYLQAGKGDSEFEDRVKLSEPFLSQLISGNCATKARNIC